MINFLVPIKLPSALYKAGFSCFTANAAIGHLRRLKQHSKDSCALSTLELKGGHVYTPSYPSERRKARRLATEVEAELSADLTLLDASEKDVQADPLLLLGATRDISALGVGLVIPSIRVDDAYCAQSHLMPLSLHLTDDTVQFIVKAVHSQPIVANDPDRGFVLGLRIVDFQDSGPAWQQYLGGLTQ